jgi:hypothetical protein
VLDTEVRLCLYDRVVYDVKSERPSVPFEETVAALGMLIKEGKVRLGFSSFVLFTLLAPCSLGHPRTAAG